MAVYQEENTCLQAVGFHFCCYWCCWLPCAVNYSHGGCAAVVGLEQSPLTSVSLEGEEQKLACIPQFPSFAVFVLHWRRSNQFPLREFSAKHLHITLTFLSNLSSLSPFFWCPSGFSSCRKHFWTMDCCPRAAPRCLGTWYHIAHTQNKPVPSYKAGTECLIGTVSSKNSVKGRVWGDKSYTERIYESRHKPSFLFSLFFSIAHTYMEVKSIS